MFQTSSSTRLIDYTQISQILYIFKASYNALIFREIVKFPLYSQNAILRNVIFAMKFLIAVPSRDSKTFYSMTFNITTSSSIEFQIPSILMNVSYGKLFNIQWCHCKYTSSYRCSRAKHAILLSPWQYPISLLWFAKAQRTLRSFSLN